MLICFPNYWCKPASSSSYLSSHWQGHRLSDAEFLSFLESIKSQSNTLSRLFSNDHGVRTSTRIATSEEMDELRRMAGLPILRELSSSVHLNLHDMNDNTNSAGMPSQDVFPDKIDGTSAASCLSRAAASPQEQQASATSAFPQKEAPTPCSATPATIPGQWPAGPSAEAVAAVVLSCRGRRHKVRKHRLPTPHPTPVPTPTPYAPQPLRPTHCDRQPSEPFKPSGRTDPTRRRPGGRRISGRKFAATAGFGRRRTAPLCLSAHA